MAGLSCVLSRLATCVRRRERTGCMHVCLAGGLQVVVSCLMDGGCLECLLARESHLTPGHSVTLLQSVRPTQKIDHWIELSNRRTISIQAYSPSDVDHRFRSHSRVPSPDSSTGTPSSAVAARPCASNCAQLLARHT